MTREQIKSALEYIESTDSQTQELGISLIDTLDMNEYLMDITVECDKKSLVIVDKCPNYKKACVDRFGSDSPGIYNIYEKMKTEHDQKCFDEFMTNFLTKAFSQNAEIMKFKVIQLEYN
jgi:hypothetical protein